jgi:sec-independent protein translocase protein TatC
MLATTPPDVGGADEPEWDQKEMPFTEHLRELRHRLIVCVGTVLSIAVLAIWPAQQLIPMITRTYFHGMQLNAFGPADAVWAIFKFAIYIAVILGLPVILFQTWMFVVPAVNPKTRKMVYWYVAPSIVLAAAGLAFAHYLVLPRVVGALLSITASVANPVFGIEATINLVLLLFLAFALIFQTPVVMIMLARIGLINSTMLRKNRKYLAFGMMVVGAVLAPDGSPLTMTLLAAPMYVLFEIGLVIVGILEKGWKREAELAG